jgi:hypothetical protein
MNYFRNVGPLHTIAKGYDHKIVRAFETHFILELSRIMTIKTLNISLVKNGQNMLLHFKLELLSPRTKKV